MDKNGAHKNKACSIDLPLNELYHYSHDVFGGPDSHGPVRRTGEEFLVHGSQAVDGPLVSDILFPKNRRVGVVGADNPVSAASEH